MGDEAPGVSASLTGPLNTQTEPHREAGEYKYLNSPLSLEPVQCFLMLPLEAGMGFKHGLLSDGGPLFYSHLHRTEVIRMDSVISDIFITRVRQTLRGVFTIAKLLSRRDGQQPTGLHLTMYVHAQPLEVPRVPWTAVFALVNSSENPSHTTILGMLLITDHAFS